MAGSLNKVMLIGNLGRDPELKATITGQSLCRFSLATTETWKDQSGERQSRTTWHNVVVWGKQAEVAEKYLRKGSTVYVEGKIEMREYEKDGAKRTAIDIRADHFVMLDKREDNGGGQREHGRTDADPAKSAASFPDDDIPF